MSSTPTRYAPQCEEVPEGPIYAAPPWTEGAGTVRRGLAAGGAASAVLQPFLCVRDSALAAAHRRRRCFSSTAPEGQPAGERSPLFIQTFTRRCSRLGALLGSGQQQVKQGPCPLTKPQFCAWCSCTQPEEFPHPPGRAITGGEASPLPFYRCEVCGPGRSGMAQVRQLMRGKVRFKLFFEYEDPCV